MFIFTSITLHLHNCPKRNKNFIVEEILQGPDIGISAEMITWLLEYTVWISTSTAQKYEVFNLGFS